MKKNSNKELGEKAENLAMDFFKKKGYSLIEKNFTAKTGEIDLILKDKNDIIVFMEVKARYGDKFGTPQEAVTPKKQRQIIRTAHWYIQKKNMHAMNMRFDVMAIRFYPDREPSFEHIPFAFEDTLADY